MGKASNERNAQRDSSNVNTRRATKHRKKIRGVNLEPKPVKNLQEHPIATTKRGNDGMQIIW